MATLESQGRVRQKAREILKQPGVFFTLKEFFLYLSIYKKSADLALLPLTAAGLTTATTGQIVDTGAGRIYIVYAKKQDEPTAAYLAMGDNATNIAGADAADQIMSLGFEVADKEQVLFVPDGIPYTTGIVAWSATTAAGTTLSGADEAPNGFIIVGA